jgi:hypothetical protein
VQEENHRCEVQLDRGLEARMRAPIVVPRHGRAGASMRKPAANLDCPDDDAGLDRDPDA